MGGPLLAAPWQGVGAPAGGSLARGFWLAQRRSPQHARFWRDGVERFTAAITGSFSESASAAEGAHSAPSREPL
jgi:hypothetical protein